MLLPHEQKGGRKQARGTKDQVLIDKMILRNCKRRQTGLAMGWIDYKKAYDMIPHSWILKCLEIFGVADNIAELVKNSMTEWETELTSGNKMLGKVKINRGIFQGDSLSPLLFVVTLIPLSMILRDVKAGYHMGNGKKVNHLLFMDDLKLYGKTGKQLQTLVNTVRVFSEDIRMEFGISKCATLVMKRGRYKSSDGIILPNEEVIKEVDMEEGYKYLGVLEADGMKDSKMKDKITKEYFRRIRVILKSKLNGRNTITAINSRAVSIVRYGAGIIKWNKTELEKMDRKTRKLLTIYRAFHPQGDVDRLYVSRKEGGRGLISLMDCVDMEVAGLKKYVMNSKEELLICVKEEEVLGRGKEKKEIQNARLKRYEEKNLHGKFYSATKKNRDTKSWTWLQQGELKKETEGMLTAAQDQALRTRYIRKVIDKEDISAMCRLCGERDETIAHIVSECKMLAQKQYKQWRHDKVAQIIHWDICRKHGLEHQSKWYEHIPETVVENEEVKVLWDMNIQTDKVIAANKPDIVVFEKLKRKCVIVDVACPFDTRLDGKAKEKIEKYQDLKRELQRIWQCQDITIVPIIIGALGTIDMQFEKWIKKLEINTDLKTLQKACLLGTARILRKVLDT